MKPNQFCLLLIRNLNAAPMLQSRCMMVQFVAIKRVGTNIWDQSLEHDDDDENCIMVKFAAIKRVGKRSWISAPLVQLFHKIA